MQRLNVFHIPTANGADISCDLPWLKLATCQRTMWIGFFNTKGKTSLSDHPNIEHYQSAEAYQFLLEVICGLKSRVIGENEIRSQFKQAFIEYLQSKERIPELIRLMEKLFKDAKDIRSNYLTDIGKNSYTGISRRIFSNASEDKEVLILGSGQLATDLIAGLQKRFSLSLSARNSQKVSLIADQWGTQSVDWLDFDSYKDYSKIVLALSGPDNFLTDDNFFRHWSKNHTKKIFIDLTSPTLCQTNLSKENGFYTLENIFQEGAIKEEAKQKKISMAKAALKEISVRRVNYLNRSFSKFTVSKAQHA